VTIVTAPAQGENHAETPAIGAKKTKQSRTLKFNAKRTFRANHAPKKAGENTSLKTTTRIIKKKLE